MSIPWLKILKYGLPALLLGLAIWWAYSLGSSHGKAVVQADWDAQKKLDEKLVEAIKTQNQKDEEAHRAEDRRISDELVAAKEQAAAGNAANDRVAAERLRNSEQRAALYRSQAEAGATERANLAGHAAELDRLLAESLGLLEEGRLLIELRDGQIRGLAAQINNDRQLISGQSTANGNDAAPAQ